MAEPDPFTRLNASLADAMRILDEMREIVENRPAEPAALSLEMQRCLAFVDAMKEVDSWPIVICSVETADLAVDAGWLETGRRPMVPRLGWALTVYRLTDAGRAAYFGSLT